MSVKSVAFAAEGTGEDLLRWVDPRIGTGGHGHCYPGASVPFGAVQLSPDTFDEGWDWCSGYHVSDESLMGFSHTHLSGTGCNDLLDFLVMAGTGEAKLVPGTREHPEEGYRSRFSHAEEVASPGYYSVLLKDYGVKAELSATERAGIHRYTFPKSEKAYLILDLHHATAEKGKSLVESAELEQVAPDTLAGGHVTNAWAKGRKAFFTMQFSKTPKKIVYFKDDAEVSLTSGKLAGANLKCVLYFETRAGEQILVKTGISGVSAEGAGKNLRAEIPAWEFAQVRHEAEEKWRRQIGKVNATFADEGRKKVFYTALYHLSLGPTLFDDVDGRYRGMDGAVHTLPDSGRNYTSFSLWDTYRAAHPVYTLIDRERVPGFMNTLIRMAEQSPAGMPVWPLYGRETGTMTGYHSAAVIAEACAKGFTGIDYNAAYTQMMKRAMVEDYRGLGYYRTLGFIPADKEEESVSKTFEYCYDDWSIAHVAKHLGKTDDVKLLVERSKNYKHYYDKSTGFMRPKMADGSWASPFSPIALGHSKKWRDYTESNAWQSTFAIQHDVAGLIDTLGGKDAFTVKLDSLFTVPSTLPDDAPPDIAGMVGQYAHGNEPSHHIAYLYVHAGSPAKTQARVRSLMETMYAPLPDGMQGNEDVGQMSAWFLMSALGFYPVDAASGTYIVGSPLVDRASVDLGNGKALRIVVKRTDPAHQYVRSISIDGKKQERMWFQHAEIAQGATVTFEMAATPGEAAGMTLPPGLEQLG